MTARLWAKKELVFFAAKVDPPCTQIFLRSHYYLRVFPFWMQQEQLSRRE
jgi:hypothetical protein